MDADTAKEIQDAKTKNLIWFLARMTYPEIQTIYSWTGFNIQIRDEVTVVQDIISYLPTINAPATKMSTVNEELNQTLSIMESLKLDKIVCVFDQALYAKAAVIVWRHDLFKNVIIRMRLFHMPRQQRLYGGMISSRILSSGWGYFIWGHDKF